MKKKLEDDYLARSLRGRIQYFATAYRESHDGDKGRVAIRLDGNEILKGNTFDKYDKIYQAWRELNRESWKKSASIALERGGFDQYSFYVAFEEYDNQSIEASLESANALVRLWAVLDRRVGKRRLQGLGEKMKQEIDFVRFFYMIRMEAEGLSLKQEESTA